MVAKTKTNPVHQVETRVKMGQEKIRMEDTNNSLVRVIPTLDKVGKKMTSKAIRTLSKTSKRAMKNTTLNRLNNLILNSKNKLWPRQTKIRNLFNNYRSRQKQIRFKSYNSSKPSRSKKKN